MKKILLTSLFTIFGIWLNTISSIAQSPLILSARIEPTVIRNGIDSFSLNISVSPEVQSLSLKSNGILLYNNTGDTFIRLYDDGTHGDYIAGDKIFSINKITLSFDPISQSGKPIVTMNIRMDSARVAYSDGSKETIYANLSMLFGFLDAAIVPVPLITVLDSDMRKTDYCVNIVSPVAPPFYYVDLQQISQRYYNRFPDNKDFLIVSDPFIRMQDQVAGFFTTIHNYVKGIGVYVNTDSIAVGGSSILQGIVHTQGSLNAGLLDHELLHRWAAFTDPSLGMGSGHWSAIQRPTSGFGPAWGAYNRFVPVQGNSYKAYLNADSTFGYYSDLELYLMGLCKLSDVASPIEVLVNPVDQGIYGYDANTGQTYKNFYADSIRHIKVTDIVALMGERLPDYENSQKNFSSSLIVVHDRPLTDIEFAYYDYFMREYEKSSSPFLAAPTFQSATGGRATMSTLITENTEMNIPPVPTLVSPADGSGGKWQNLVLSWDESAGASLYRLQVSVDREFKIIKFDDSTITTTFRQIDSLSGNTTYFWHVSASNAYGTSPFSTYRTFTISEVVPTSDMTVALINGATAVYPNPTTGIVYIEVPAHEAEKVNVTITDMFGNLIRTKEMTDKNSLQLDLSGQPNGIYLLKIKVNDKIHTCKLIVLY